MIVRNQGALKWSVQVSGKLMLSNQTTFRGIADIRSFLEYVWVLCEEIKHQIGENRRIEADAAQVLLLSSESHGESNGILSEVKVTCEILNISPHLTWMET